MTARQPPGEKGAKACTIGNTSPASWIFLYLFGGGGDAGERGCDRPDIAEAFGRKYTDVGRRK